MQDSPPSSPPIFSPPTLPQSSFPFETHFPHSSPSTFLPLQFLVLSRFLLSPSSSLSPTTVFVFYFVLFLFFFRVASLFIDNNNVHFTVWFWDIPEGGVVCKVPHSAGSPIAPTLTPHPTPGVLLYLCVSDARDIAVYEIIKEVNAYS